MTHRLGLGTRNVSVNLLIEEDAALGRLACTMDVSKGHLLRRGVDHVLKSFDPRAAAGLRRARIARRERHFDHQLSLGI